MSVHGTFLILSFPSKDSMKLTFQELFDISTENDNIVRVSISSYFTVRFPSLCIVWLYLEQLDIQVLLTVVGLHTVLILSRLFCLININIR